MCDRSHLPFEDDAPDDVGDSDGLIGLFGHSYHPAVAESARPEIKCQFQIIRPHRDDRYIVQMFSWIAGDPTNVTVMSEAELLGPNVKLFATQELWNEAALKEKEAGARPSKI